MVADLVADANAARPITSGGTGAATAALARTALYVPPISALTSLVQGRLTLTTGLPVTTADVTAAITLYFTPFRGNSIALYSGTLWQVLTFAELSLSLAGYTASKPYDIFAYDNAGAVALESAVWTNETSRATALVLQDGVYVKSGATTRRYIGTIYMTATGQTEDSLAKRYVWNMYNRVPRSMRRLETTDTWTYTTAAFRVANGNTANELAMVIGLDEDAVSVRLMAAGSNNVGNGVTLAAAIGLDSSSAASDLAISSPVLTAGANFLMPINASIDCNPGIGRHAFVWLEYSLASNTTTWYGDGGGTGQHSGLSGSCMA